jgi:glycosyltransferase involved in cell wall biosynthesis
MRWAIVTGEYPPQPGGVADHTRLVAHGLAARGDEVHVWAPATSDAGHVDAVPNVTVHRLPGGFGPRDLATLGAALDRSPVDRLLVQYVPHAFGWRAMNLPFAWWLRGRRDRDAVWVVFHEVAFPFRWRQRPAHMLLAGATRLMAATIARAAARTYVTTPAWEPLLPRRAASARPTWLPVPSNVATTVDAAAVAATRARVAPADGALVVGHFGTFGNDITPGLSAALAPLLRDDRRVGLLIGRGAERFASELRRAHPDVGPRVVAADDLSGEAIATHLAACDLLVQPYPDGATSRRGTLMAGLALGIPIATTDGALTEPVWRESGAVALAPADAPGELAAVAEALLRDPARRAALGRRAADLYASRFAVDHTIAALRAR